MQDPKATGRPVPEGAIVRRSPRVVSQELLVEPGMMLLNLDTRNTFGLNEVGTFIWGLIETPIAFELLRNRVAAELPDAPATLDTELGEFLHGLADRGLVVLETAVDPRSDGRGAGPEPE